MDNKISAPPYFIFPMLEQLRRTSDPEEQMMLKRRIAVNMGDIGTLRVLFGEDPEEFTAFYPDMTKPDLSTEDTIDTFIDRFGKAESLAGDTLLPAAPAIDYAATILESETENGYSSSPSDDTSSLIDSFLDANPAPGAKPTGENAKPAQDASLSESLAFAMIKNRNYSKALQIISELSLIYPEKSIYFADQIRFLRKLILIESKA